MCFRLIKPGWSALVAVCLLVGLAACTGSGGPKPDQVAAQAFLDAVGSRDATAAAGHTTDPAAAGTLIGQSLDGLGSDTKANFTISAVTDRTKTTSTAHYSASWSVPGVPKPWTYVGTLPMVKSDSGWQVHWQASDMYPGLATGQHLMTLRVQPTRANLLDSDGSPLFTSQDVVTVGINPQWVKDLNSLADKLATFLHISAADIISSVKAAPKDQFVPVITLRKSAYDEVRPLIHDLSGTEFQTGTQLLPPTTGWGEPLLGQVGQATKQIIDESSGKVAAGDLTGLSGLQQALNDQLAGTPGIRVYSAGKDNKPLTKLADLTVAQAGTSVKLTIDHRIQDAAQNALANVANQAAIVVTQPSTGRVLAVANSQSADGDIALTGQYPPGSSFKMVTYTAAFMNNPSLAPTTPLACPATISVNGQTVRNENEFDKGTVAAADAFAFSCNTTAANLGLQLPSGALVTAARSLGLGAQWKLPVPAFSGSLPEPSGASAENEKAADAYGQGKVLVSPLLMASIAGAAATGKTIAPSLLDGQQQPVAHTQPTQITSYLNALMRDVVTIPGATGNMLADLPGQVEGKTGTAEYGSDVPPKSHSWFAGTRGDLAFAVFVYGGGDSGPSAVSLTHSLLSQL